jgi:hypothetical protein
MELVKQEKQNERCTSGLLYFLQMYDYWRVGIRWDVMPHRMWPNGTVPYVISPLYGKSDFNFITLHIIGTGKVVPVLN